jgi:EAL domain-containing protein (putative c-di-GMP-specific phosphodiesterase class I)
MCRRQLRELRPDENFLKGVFAILDDAGVNPGLLELELTESVLMRDAGPMEFQRSLD